MSLKHQSGAVSAIPQYFLYGESTRDVEQHFLHIETLASRCCKHGWSILPHAHGELHHLLFIESGNGQCNMDANNYVINAPMIISVPAQCVHEFRFDPDTQGWIISSSSALLHRISQTYPEFESLLYQSVILQVDAIPSGSCREKFSALAREFHNDQVARHAAAESWLLSILVDAIRIRESSNAGHACHHDADADLVVRYKNLIETHFRSRVGAAEYATRLCVCHERLRSACVKITGTSPLVLLNARRLLEAKRFLLYTNSLIAEVAYQAGFEDPAYFSRFFTRNTGKSPREYRLTHAR